MGEGVLIATIYLKHAEWYVLRLKNGDQITGGFVDSIDDGDFLRFVFFWSWGFVKIKSDRIVTCTAKLEREDLTKVFDHSPHEFVVLPKAAIRDALDTPNNLPSFKVWYKDQVERGLIKEEE